MLTFFHGTAKTSRLMWTTHSGIGALKVPFQAKLTKMPLVNPGLTNSQNWSKSLQNHIFHVSTSNPSYLVIFVNFDQV